MLTQYGLIKKLPKDVQIRLELDGESLDPKMQVGDTELEDGDMLTAVVL
jgi:hypothetical protein